MSNSSKICTTGYYGGQALALGLLSLALHFPAGAQPAPGPTPIAFDQTVQGTLTSTDPLTQEGIPVDTYSFTVTAPGPYFIKATSPDIPVYSALYRVTPTGFVGQQDGSVFTPGQTLGLFGVLNQPGRYEIDVQTLDAQQPTGPSGTASYTLSLTNTPPAAASPSTAGAPTR